MFKKNENGQAIVILAIAMVVLLAFAALAIDAGNGYAKKREAQNAADAGAMAGARQIVLECGKQGLPNQGPSEAAVLNSIVQMVGTNSPNASVEAYYVGADGARLSDNQIGTLGAVPCNCAAGRAQGVEVIVNNSTKTFLAGLMGQNAMDVHTSAKARYGAVTTVTSNLYPFTRRNLPLTFNQFITLRVLDDADTLPGNFGWLTWDGANNTPTLVQSLTPPGDSEHYFNPGTPANNWTANPNDHQISIGKWVQGAPGNKNAAGVRAQLDWHIANHTAMIIPLYDEVAGQGSHSNYRVASFAAFELQSYDFTGQTKSMTGRFLRWVTNGDWATNITCQSDPGIESVKLTP